MVFPRTIGQVPLLEKFEEKLGFHIGAFVEIALTREIAEARMTGRRVCPKCGATYHLLAKPPQVPETCDLDGITLERRKDDKAEIVDVRQQIYRRIRNADPQLLSQGARVSVSIRERQPISRRGLRGNGSCPVANDLLSFLIRYWREGRAR